MSEIIGKQNRMYLLFYAMFATASFILMMYYLSYTLIYFTSPQQFPINSFIRFPLTFLIFPAELFSFFFGIYFVYNLYTDRNRKKEPGNLENGSRRRVALVIPVYNEPKEIVDRTLQACRRVRWHAGTVIYLLDDSTNDNDKANMAQLAKKYSCTLVRRENRIGFKAGNVNNGIKKYVKEEFFAILDSDQAPEPDLLESTMGHF